MLVSERVLRVLSVQIDLARSRGALVAEAVLVAVGLAVLVAVPELVGERVLVTHDAISPVGAGAASARKQLVHPAHEKGVRGTNT